MNGVHHSSTVEVTVDSQPKIARDENEVVTPRRPYASPQLKRLGSVRELTLGSMGKAADVGVNPTMT